MSWKIRHEGSPRSIDGLNLQQVAEGLQDGLWEATDEVMGPDEAEWTAIEAHPRLADVALDLEPPPPPHRPDETTLDMNPLIDVCLVLLIFFILTTSYAALQKVLDMPGNSSANLKGVKVVSQDQVKEFMIKAEIRQAGGQAVFRIEDQEVDFDNLMGEIKRWTRDPKKTGLLIDADGKVDWDAVIKVQDAAKGAGVQKVYFAVPGEEVPEAPKK